MGGWRCRGKVRTVRYGSAVPLRYSIHNVASHNKILTQTITTTGQSQEMEGKLCNRTPHEVEECRDGARYAGGTVVPQDCTCTVLGCQRKQ